MKIDTSLQRNHEIFIGSTQYVEREYSKSDVTIGVIDSGICLETTSFVGK
jgi:hypothetical protein